MVALDSVMPARTALGSNVRIADTPGDLAAAQPLLAAGEAQSPGGSQPPATAAPEPKLDPAVLIARGNEFLLQSDVISARLFYRLAAARGSAAGAIAMGGTYDPISLERNAVRGVKPEPAAALDWYRKAGELGDTDAKTRIAQLLDNLRTAAARGDPQARAVLQNWAR
jgi:TPR repeat protein